MNRACEIVRYRPEHKQAISVLQTALWSRDPRANQRYFEWKYEQNPWAAEPRIYLALRGGRLVGMRGFYESRWEVGDPAQIVSIPLADDAVVESDERKRGLAAQIMRAALADLAGSGVDYVLSLTAGSLTLMGSLALGWKSARRYQPIARRAPDFDPYAGLRERLRHTRVLWRWADAPLLHAAAERRPFRTLDGAPSPAGLEISREPRPHAMAELCARRPRDGRLHHVRSREYLAWRFANPMHDYRFLYATCGDRLDGYLVLRTRVMGLHPTPGVCVADLEGGDDRVRATLLAAAIDAGRFAELSLWSSSLAPGDRALLNERGFAPLDAERSARGWPCLLVRATRDDAASPWSLGARPLLDPASWDVRMLDSMAG
jgi:GNAT superfamily N-acetyltransferase